MVFGKWDIVLDQGRLPVPIKISDLLCTYTATGFFLEDMENTEIRLSVYLLGKVSDDVVKKNKGTMDSKPIYPITLKQYFQ